MFKRLFAPPNFLPLVVVLFFGILASWSLLGKGYFNMHDDLQLMRQLEMEKCFNDFQIPCRWVPDMGYGYGFPLFNFYPPLPYLVGQGIRLFGFDFISTAKGLFALALITSGVTMYFLAKEFFGRIGGIISAVFYVWAPYHAVDVYVRGAMNESWALVWFPLILWAGYRLSKDKKSLKWIITLALGWFGLLTSHNLMVLMFAPVFAVWSLIWIWKNNGWKKIPQFIISGIWGFGFAAFFTIPAVIENKMTHIESVLVGYYDYSGHFATINQILFSRFWGYGPSVWLENDGMSFQVGHIHWIFSLVILACLVYRFIKNKKFNKVDVSLIVMFIVGWFATFLIHSKSTPIWLAVSPLKYLQFPWRFLAMPTFAFSFLVGSVAYFLDDTKYRKLLLVILTIGIVVFNWSYFKPQHGKLGPLTDEEKLSGVAWDLQQTAGIYDYLPKWAKTAPKAPQKFIAETARGNVKVENTSQGTNWIKFTAKVEDEKAWVRVNTFYFPGWIATYGGKEVTPYVPDEEEWGRMWIELPKGEHNIELRFKNTPVRTVGNILSFVSWGILISTPLWKRKI